MTTYSQSNALMTATQVIDFEKHPSVPEGMTILRDDGQLPNRLKEKISFDPVSFWLCGTEINEDLGYINGRKIHKDLARVKDLIVGAQLLDFFLANPRLIPKKFSNRMRSTVYFWGTIYQDATGKLFVRGLRRFATGWSETEPKLIESDDWLQRYEPAVMIRRWCLPLLVS